jgi:cytochrome P450
MLASLWRYRNIPGPTPLPLFGNLLTLVMNQNIHEVYQQWEAAYGKKYKWFMGSGVVIVLSDVELVREVGLRRFSGFMNHMAVPDKILPLLPEEMKAMSKYSMDVSRDKYWKGLRSTANSIFHNVEILRSFCPLMEETASELVEKLRQVGEGESVDIWRALGDMTLDVIGSTVFGVRFNCIQSKGADAVKAARIIFRQNIVSLSWNPYLALGVLAPKFMIPPLEFLSRILPTSAMKEVDWAMNVLADLSNEMVENANLALSGNGNKQDESNSSGSHNFLKLFIQAHNRETGKPLSKDEVKAQALLYLLAGYETTANTLAYAVYLLSKNKDKEQVLIDEISRLETEGGGEEEEDDLKSYVYVEATVRESLRMFGPIPFTDRQASGDQQLKDFKVVKDQVIHIATRNMHYNPEYFPEVRVDVKKERERERESAAEANNITNYL